MPDTKTLRNRIKSVDSTLHLTKAMGLVASSKIRKANQAMFHSRDYAVAAEQIVEQLTTCPECRKSPYMHPKGDRTCLVVIAGDRGLAGGYNANIFRMAKEYPDAEILPIGKRACDRYGAEVISSETFPAETSVQIAKTLCKRFLNGEFGRVGILGTEYISMMTQTPRIRWILPLSPSETGKTSNTIFEPDEITILNDAIPEYIAGILSAEVRESFTCEVAARRMAMDSAGKNAQQMIEDLQLSYNRARQGAITQEITEIVAGSGI